MDFFDLPKTTSVNKVIPKNAFHEFSNSALQKVFTDKVLRINWTNKLSTDTVNLSGKEIQLFRIELKTKDEIKKVLEVIDKSIPYNIIFLVESEGQAFISTSSKHENPINENGSIIDWTFKSKWFAIDQCPFNLNITQSLDNIYKDICIQISGKIDYSSKTFENLVKNQQEVSVLKREIVSLKAKIKRSKQFNVKVELNLKLKGAEKNLKKIEDIE